MSNVSRELERYRFTCRNCRRAWYDEYEVCSDAGGATGWHLYYHHGATCENPTGNLMICPYCRHTTVHARREPS